MKLSTAIAGGLLLAFIGHFLAIGVAGAGHGWITPFWVSTILWVAYPLALFRAVKVSSLGSATLKIELPIVILALASDAALVLQTKREGVEHFWRLIELEGWILTGPWMTIWLGWQLVALLNLVGVRKWRTA